MDFGFVCREAKYLLLMSFLMSTGSTYSIQCSFLSFYEVLV
jgi:hypothetical protein